MSVTEAPCEYPPMTNWVSAQRAAVSVTIRVISVAPGPSLDCAKSAA
jgi:hypothetical protein